MIVLVVVVTVVVIIVSIGAAWSDVENDDGDDDDECVIKFSGKDRIVHGVNNTEWEDIQLFLRTDSDRSDVYCDGDRNEKASADIAVSMMT